MAALIGPAFLALFAFQSIWSMGNSVYEYETHADDLKANIESINKEISDYNDKYKELLKNMSQTSQQARDDIMQNLKVIDSISQAARGKKLLHTESFQKVKSTRTIILIFLILILALKVTGIFKMITNSIQNVIHKLK